MKLCKDCKFIKLDPVSRLFRTWSMGYCTSPQRPFYPASTDPVTGAVSPARQMQTCVAVRSGDCGDDAKFFEPRR